jgi:hypothetical protein
MKIGRKFSVGVLALIFGPSPLLSQDRAATAEKAALIRTLREIQFRARSIQESSAGDSALATAAGDVQKSATWLRRSAERWSPKKRGAGQDLFESVERMLKVLRDAPSGSPALESALSSVAEDLRVKAEHCEKTGLASRLDVKVVTKRNGLDEVRGLKVLYIEKFFQSDPSARPHEFRGFSSPAEDSLVPGRYVFWAREPGASGRNGERKEASVGNGLSQASIEVLAP